MNKINSVVLFCAGLVLILFSTLILTRPALIPIFDFSDKGEIGDTIGGISGPIINLIGAILVYKSFREQYESNVIQRLALDNEIKQSRNKRDFELLNALFDDIKKNVENFKYVSYLTGGVSKSHDVTHPTLLEYKGLNGMFEYIKWQNKNSAYFTNDDRDFNSYLLEFKYILAGFVLLVNKIRDTRSLDVDDRVFLISSIDSYYSNKLDKVYSELIEIGFSTDQESDFFINGQLLMNSLDSMKFE
jgi:hypothetical protein